MSILIQGRNSHTCVYADAEVKCGLGASPEQLEGFEKLHIENATPDTQIGIVWSLAGAYLHLKTSSA